MVTVSRRKRASHPASQSFPMDISELCVNPGKRCAGRAAAGSCGMSNSHATLFECSWLPSGSPTIIVC